MAAHVCIEPDCGIILEKGQQKRCLKHAEEHRKHMDHVYYSRTRSSTDVGTMVPCDGCGTLIFKHHSGKKYCDICREKRNEENNKKSRAKIGGDEGRQDMIIEAIAKAWERDADYDPAHPEISIRKLGLL